jgi:microcompartment protein CcmK/EutM
MQLCLVTGNVVATRKNERLREGKLLVVHPIDVRGRKVGTRDLLALDPKFDAGVGDVVMIAKEGAVVAQLMDSGKTVSAEGTPANVIIIAVVDDWHTAGKR